MLHRVSIVIPVYQGEHTLAALVEEIALLAVPTRTEDGHRFQVTELLLVHDKGPEPLRRGDPRSRGSP